MKSQYLLFLSLFLAVQLNSVAQVKIGDNPNTINASAILELESTTKGVLLPRMSETQRDAISTPPTGLWIFNTTANMPQYYDGAGWTTVADQKAFGSVYFIDNPTATTFSSADTYTPVLASSFSTGPSIDLTLDSSTGRITYTGTVTKHFHIVINGSVKSSSNAQLMYCGILKNGVLLGAPVERKTAGVNDVGAFSTHADAMLSTGDYLEVNMKNKNETYAITMKHMYFFIMSMN